MARINNLTNFLTDVAAAIKTKKGDNTPIPAANFDTEIINLPGGSGGKEAKDVNFYDYDGTITNSYTKNEFLALSAMPDNPTHEGLTSQGWNWTLSDAQTYVTNNGALEIGQMYVTDDNSTRLYVTIESLNRTPYVGIGINGTATVNWGDGNTSTLTGSSISTVTTVSHTYANEGDYVISISSESDYAIFNSDQNSTSIFFGGATSSNTGINSPYNNNLNKIELSNNVSLGNYALRALRHLKSITMPNTITTLGQYVIQYTESLKHLTIPNSCTDFSSYCIYNTYLETISIPSELNVRKNYAFASNEYLKRMTLPIKNYRYIIYLMNNLNKLIIPIGTTAIEAYAFSYNYSLSEVKIPNTVTYFGSSIFINCYNLRKVDCSTYTSVPTGGTAMFANCHADLKIIVPDDLYATWKTTSGWSTYADNIVKVSEV